MGCPATLLEAEGGSTQHSNPVKRCCLSWEDDFNQDRITLHSPGLLRWMYVPLWRTAQQSRQPLCWGMVAPTKLACTLGPPRAGLGNQISHNHGSTKRT